MRKTIYLALICIFFSCSTQRVTKLNFYFKDGDTFSGYTKAENPYSAGSIFYRKKEKSFWFHQMDKEYLMSYTIGLDSFSIVPKSEIFAKVIESGKIDFYEYTYQSDSCTTSEFVEVMNTVEDILYVGTLLSGEVPCPNDDYLDDDCQKLIRYSVKVYILINNELDQSLSFKESNFSRKNVIGFFKEYPMFYHEMAKDSFTVHDLKDIIKKLNNGSSSTN